MFDINIILHFFYWPGNQFFLIGDEGVKYGYPKLIRLHWRNLPDNIDAAVHFPQAHYAIDIGWVWNESNRKYEWQRGSEITVFGDTFFFKVTLVFYFFIVVVFSKYSL